MVSVNESHGSARRIGETDLNTKRERKRGVKVARRVSGRLGSSGPDPRAFCSNSLHQISRGDERWYCFQIGFRFEGTIATRIHAHPHPFSHPPAAYFCLFDLVPALLELAAIGSCFFFLAPVISIFFPAAMIWYLAPVDYTQLTPLDPIILAV